MRPAHQRCGFCGDDVPGAAGCSVTLYAGAGVRVGRVWLPLCANDVRYVERLAREERLLRSPLPTCWRVTSLHDGATWMLW